MSPIFKDFQKIDSIISNPFNQDKHLAQIEKMIGLFLAKLGRAISFNHSHHEHYELNIQLTMILKEKLNTLMK